MFYLQGLSQKEIAEELGYGNAAVVKNLKFRALQKCRVMYFDGLCSMGRDPLGRSGPIGVVRTHWGSRDNGSGTH